MRQERFTEQAQEAMGASQQLVREFKHSQWDVEHILLALLQQEKGLVSDIIKELGVDIEFLKKQRKPDYKEEVLKAVPEDENSKGEDEYDIKYDEAVALVTETRQASISMVQRRLRVGYNRAARMIETMEREGVVGPSDGSRPREVLVRSYEE